MGLRLRRRARTDRGAAALEFALIVPILLLLVYGIISFGLMLTLRQGLSQAAAEGARAAAVELNAANRTNAAQLAVGDAIAFPDLTCTGGQLRNGATVVGTCVVGAAANCAGAAAVGGVTPQCVTVTLTYNYRANALVPAVPLIDQTLPTTLRYAATVRVS